MSRPQPRRGYRMTWGHNAKEGVREKVGVRGEEERRERRGGKKGEDEETGKSRRGRTEGSRGGKGEEVRRKR